MDIRSGKQGCALFVPEGRYVASEAKGRGSDPRRKARGATGAESHTHRPYRGCGVSRYLPAKTLLPRHGRLDAHLTGTQYLGIISFMDCSMCTEPIPEPRRLVVPHTLTCSPECSRQRIRWRSRERAKLQRQRRKAANAANRQKA